MVKLFLTFMVDINNNNSLFPFVKDNNRAILIECKIIFYDKRSQFAHIKMLIKIICTYLIKK